MRAPLAATVAALAAVAVAYSVVVQKVSCNQTTHYSLVQALADGTPRTDRYWEQSCDFSYIEGHWYAAKGPLLAFVSLPFHLAFDAAGLVPVNPGLGQGWPAAMEALDPRAIWQLHLFGIVLPTLLLLVLAGLLADRLAPGTGLAVAVTLGLGTVVFPFASDYWAHTLAAALGFLAFWLLFRERHDRPGRLWLVTLAGVAVMLAALAEYATGLLALPLAAYVALGRPRLKRLGALALGGAIGGIPHALYNTWALGAPNRLTYENWVRHPGESGHDVIIYEDGVFGIEWPRPRDALDLLFEGRGLLTLTPVLAMAAVGLVLLYRRGRRAEALVAAGFFALIWAYVSGFVEPWGGISAGPRYLIVALPFLAVGLATAFAVAPGITVALAAASIGAMTLATGGEPMLDSQRSLTWVERWREYFRDGEVPTTVVTLLTGHRGLLALAPLVLAVAVAAVLALRPHVRAARARAEWREGLAALAAWALIPPTAPELLQADRREGTVWGFFAVVALALALALVVYAVRRRSVAAAAGLPLPAVLAPGIAGSPPAVLAVALLSLALLAVLSPSGLRRALPGRPLSAPRAD
jgi:hypothetical protein